MINDEHDPFLLYYHRELSYLRKAGPVFAAQHPKIARRLDLSGTETPDPHTERLLESFAFMTARLSQEIDDRLPQLSSALLEVLYPHLITPLPAVMICQFKPASGKGKITKGFKIPAHTPVFSYAEEGLACRFQTSYPVTLWPLDIIHADLIEPGAYTLKGGGKFSSYVRLRLKAQDLLFSDLHLTELVVHLSGDPITKFALYDALFATQHPEVLWSVDGQTAHCLPEHSLIPLGFSEKETLLPSPLHCHPAYALLQEYSRFPEKFLFFKIKNFPSDKKVGQIEILIGIEDNPHGTTLFVSEDNFLLGCTPAVNLFPKITEPLRLTHQKHEYHLIPDLRRDRTTEIYAIDRISCVVDDEPEAQTIPPYFSFNHGNSGKSAPTFWVGRRVPAVRKELPGTDLFLSFVDLNFNPKLPPLQTVYGHVLCTNRYLADQLPSGAEFNMEDHAPLSHIVSVGKPLTQVYSPPNGETLWKLVSQLCVSHLSVTQGEVSIDALKETLRLYSRGSSRLINNEIEALESLTAEPIVRRLGQESWRGFLQGVALTLTVNERAFTGGSAILMGAVLRQFFSLQVSLNSFTELRLHSQQRKEEWARWKPTLGEQPLL